MAKNDKKKTISTTATPETGPSNPGTPRGDASPVVINAQYIKDLSFENPNPLQNFTPNNKAPEYNVNLELNIHQVAEHSYEVTIALKVDATREKATLYIAELAYAGVFTLNGVPENALHPLLMIQCPQYLFPYARSIISQMTTDGGFPPFLLNPIDFAALYQQKMAEQAQENTQATAGSKKSSK
jgi:preprotein translocase subunit SecB